MILDRNTRLVIIGNSGSGKSTVATHVAAATGLSTYDFDLIHWHDDGSKRDELESKALVARIAAADSWIVEGVYGWLAEVALVEATALIWTDLCWSECREGLLARGLRRGMTSKNQDDLIVWAENYWSRSTPSSFAGHKRIYAAFNGPKLRLKTRADVSALLFCEIDPFKQVRAPE